MSYYALTQKIENAYYSNTKILDLSLPANALDKDKFHTFPLDVLKLKNLQHLKISNHAFQLIPNDIYLLDELITIDLTNNRLRSIPSTIVFLKNIKNLILTSNVIEHLPPEIENLRSLEQLGIGGNNFVEVPNWISQFINLEMLDLSSLNIAELPFWLKNLKKLKKLFLSGNPLQQLPDWITEFKFLTHLSCQCCRLNSLPNDLAQLNNLSSLLIGGNNLSIVPESITNLTNLTELDISGNQIDSLPDIFSKLYQLSSLNLGGNKLTTIPKCVANFTNLQKLNLHGNYLDSLPNWIEDFKQLEELHLGNNRFVRIPEALFQLTDLKNLYLSNFDSFPIYNIKINLKFRNQISDIPIDILKFEKLEQFDISGNNIIYPPPEIIRSGQFNSKELIALKAYFHQLEDEGYDHIYEAKLLIIGEGGAGKTSLANKIIDPTYILRGDEETTQGINLLTWTFKMQNGRLFRVNLWDFGGQEIYHATHQFFLTKRSLYLLVTDTRREDTDFYYWLNIVRLLSNDSPVFIIKNEKQSRQRDINERQLRRDFSGLKQTLATNLATGTGLDEILNEIKHYICQLPHIGAPLPKTWVKVRETLESDPRNYIYIDEFMLICTKNGFSRTEDKLQLSGYLHDLGVCLHFQEDALLRRIVILKPQWGTDAVYKVLDNNKVKKNLGRFTKSDLTLIWYENNYKDMQDELLQLMINFKLCYKAPNNNEFIAPQLLNENQPDYEWDRTNNLRLRYRYDFLPKGIITRFIVEMNEQIVDQLVWRTGVVLEKDGARAEIVEYYGRREIFISVYGILPRDLMTIVTYELDNIHKSFTELKFEKLIPCNCQTCKSIKEPHFYPIERLKKFINDKQKTIQCPISYDMVDVRGLIDDVLIISEINEVYEAKQEKTINIENIYINEINGSKINMSENNPKIRSAWANGMFYLFSFVVVITGIGFLANSVSIWALPIVIIAGAVFIPLIGALQLKQDNRLSEKSFMQLITMVLDQLPLVSQLARLNRPK